MGEAISIIWEPMICCCDYYLIFFELRLNFIHVLDYSTLIIPVSIVICWTWCSNSVVILACSITSCSHLYNIWRLKYGIEIRSLELISFFMWYASSLPLRPQSRSSFALHIILSGSNIFCTTFFTFTLSFPCRQFHRFDYVLYPWYAIYVR